jgi:hypothetical protein
LELVQIVDRGRQMIFADDLEKVLATTFEMLIAEGMEEAAELVRSAPAREEETGYDNWNGGTTMCTVYFSIPAADYARLGVKRTQLEEQITARLKVTVEQFTQDWYAASIVPEVVINEDWREQRNSLHKSVRMEIVDAIRLENVAWQGELDEVEFLQRLFDLSKLPSTDSRTPYNRDAAADIWQHRVNNDDWEQNWVFGDKRFNLMQGSAESFLRFLCEMLHPLVRPDRDEAIRLAKQLNDSLRSAGWELFEEQKIAGRSRYAYRRLNRSGGRSVSRARTVADALDAGYMEKQIQRVEHAIEKDPDLAIGTAKELVESCCKSILTKRKVDFSRAADLGALTKLVVKELKLVPEGISDEVKGFDNVRLILMNLTALTNNLAQLRGLYGTGHGRDGNHRGLEARHARLAVAASVAFIDFISETYRQRESQKPVGE